MSFESWAYAHRTNLIDIRDLDGNKITARCLVSK